MKFFRLFCCLVAVGLMVPAVAQGFEQGGFRHVMTIGGEGTGDGQFKYVEDFAFTHDGKLLVTDAAHAFVQVFDPQTGAFLTKFGGKGDHDSNLEKPEGIAVAPNGDIFVADFTTGYVKIYDKDYVLKKIFSGYGFDPGRNIKSELCSIYNGKFYMAEAGNHRVSVFDLDGNFLFLFGTEGKGKLNNPEAAKANSRGMIYVSDLKNDRMVVFTENGEFYKTWGETGDGNGEFSAPAGVGMDKYDNVYVTEIGNNRVQVFDESGNFITKFGSKGAGTGRFGNLHGCMVDKATGRLFVADTANNRIQVFEPTSAMMEKLAR